ncbi:MAG: ABC transporter permease [Candidatus Krumholzibacteria bacterium]|nr:ABC transporter permease [Candidatus Krumholzibacteria bacterium]
MPLAESVRLGAGGLAAHRLRTLLTTLGIVFGVAAVISMLSIGEGARRKVLAQYAQLGIDNLLVIDKPAPVPEDDAESRPFSRGLTLADAAAVREVVPLVRRVVPLRITDLDVQAGRRRVGASIVGTTPDYTEAMRALLARGRFFDWTEVDSLDRVCVLGSGLARDLFLFADPLGERVKVGRDWYTVVGVTAGAATAAGKDLADVRDTDRDVYIPVSSALQRLPRDPYASELHRLVVQVGDTERLFEVGGVLTALITRRHRGVDDHRLVVPAQLIRQQQATQRIFNVVMGTIAGISLLVGGIGIMNIMLASVLERTREIGVRRAIGATERDILLQFLLEAVGVSFLGGVLGIALGFGLTQAVAGYAGWPVAIAPWSVLMAFGVSTAVGILFGYYPARRAARMNPIDSLRYE